ncbi:RNA-directed DNA polymerase [Dendrobium catenatum]|uniref:RNA-directed DNA polymerase n=1 Tax=Dendrobium catenatum TaxID=906689 RepID=A0A2I0V9W0_9ASPA|nr:RNA-directed DNA polymerase [Dendrobium catenatum]
MEAEPAPEELEDGEQAATMDELKEVNLGTEEDPRPTFISSLLPEEQIEEIQELLCEFRDCFAWIYAEMPGLSPDVAVHRLTIKPDVTPVKQAPRRMRLEIEEQVIAETKKLIDAGFIREEKYADWIANIVPVKKKNGQIRVCIDFRDLNKACPKDDFPLPVSELLVDNTSNYDMFSFMDGSSGYNQIKMAPEDKKHTSFRTPIGIFCYTVMPFGLKNAGATYQRAMTHIFDDLIHQKVECYVDDLVVKSLGRNDHLKDLRIVFERIRKFDLKMNPLKCAFGVSSGKFLGYVVRHRGIEIDPNKIKAITEMPPPRNLRQLRSLQGQLAFIRRFISNLSGRCQPFSKLMKKDVRFKWDGECQEAFDSIKRYLLNPPILAAPIPGKPLILYTAALEESLGALLAQNNEEGKENALYYISRRLIGAESRYSPIEKHCLALIFAVQKLRHYMLSHKITLISKIDPLKFLMTRPALTGRLARWAVLLLQFEIIYMPQKAVKGQALADFLAAHPIPADSPLNDDLPDEQIMQVEENERQPFWEMYFDGASSIRPVRPPNIARARAGIGLIFVAPEGGIMRFSFSLTEPRTNNEAEYEALLAGLEIAIDVRIQHLQIFGDSQLVINQVQKSIMWPRDVKLVKLQNRGGIV